MLKKTLLVGAGATLVLGLLFGRNASSYVRTAYDQVQQGVKENVPVTFDIERARKMIQDLDPEIERNMRLIAREEVEVDKLVKQVAKAEVDLAKNRDDILRLKGDLDSGTETFVYAGRSYSAKQVKSDLTSRFNRFKTKEATTDNLQKILRARESGLAAAREKLEEMLAAKRQLQVDVENLEAQWKMVEVAQTTSDFNFDNSRLARTKDLIHDIQTRIDVAEKLVNADTRFHDEIPLEEPQDSEDISKEIANYFGEQRPEIEAFVNSAK